MGKISNEYASTEGKHTPGRARGAQRVIGILMKSGDKRLYLLITGKEQRTTGVPFLLPDTRKRAGYNWYFNGEY